MLANLTTPLLGVVATAAIGRLGDATLLGGVAMATVIFDCLFWLFALPAHGDRCLHRAGAGRRRPDDFPLILLRALLLAGVTGTLLIVLQVPLATAPVRR